MAHKKARETFVDLRWSYWENETLDRKPEEAKWWYRPTRMHYRDNPLPQDEAHDPLYLRPVPVRHWGIKNRMYTQPGLIKGVSCVMSLYYTGTPTQGPIPKAKKKPMALFKRIDHEYEEYEAKRAADVEKLRQLEEEDRLNRMREEAAILRAKRKREMEERHSKFIKDTEERHKLTREEFQRKYAHQANMGFVEWKEVWGQSKFGVWHFGELHELILQQEEEIIEITRQHVMELQELQRQHDEEEERMKDPNRIYLHHDHHDHHKRHHAYSARDRHKHRKVKHESGEERLKMLHAVEIKEERLQTSSERGV